MHWSKLKKNLKELICPELAKRLDFHITSYHRHPGSDQRDPGRGWITLDGEEIQSFSDADRQLLYEAVEQYPQLAIEKALTSPSFVVQGLALADRRVGKKRLAKISAEDLHPFARLIYELRCGKGKIPGTG